MKITSQHLDSVSQLVQKAKADLAEAVKLSQDAETQLSQAKQTAAVLDSATAAISKTFMQGEDVSVAWARALPKDVQEAIGWSEPVAAEKPVAQ
jgi:hypothetical protein